MAVNTVMKAESRCRMFVVAVSRELIQEEKYDSPG